jgi:hypothetical protein
VLRLDGRPRPLQAEKQTAEVTVGADGFTRLPADAGPPLAGPDQGGCAAKSRPSAAACRAPAAAAPRLLAVRPGRPGRPW